MHLKELLSPADYAEHCRLKQELVMIQKRQTQLRIHPTPRPKSLNEVGINMGISKERVRQIEKLALHKIKQNPIIQEYRN